MTCQEEPRYLGYGNFFNPHHALYCGWVIGSMMHKGIDVTPVADANGNWTPTVNILLGGRSVALIIPEPDDEWVPV